MDIVWYTLLALGAIFLDSIFSKDALREKEPMIVRWSSMLVGLLFRAMWVLWVVKIASLL